MNKPEALRLADELERDKWHVPAVVMQAAADELRRLHELLEAEQTLQQRVIYPELQRLRTQRDALLKALKGATKLIEHLGYPLAAIERARDAIKAVEETK